MCAETAAAKLWERNSLGHLIVGARAFDAANERASERAETCCLGEGGGGGRHGKTRTEIELGVNLWLIEIGFSSSE